MLAFETLAETLTRDGVDVPQVMQRLKALQIETPSWGYGNSGTRFKVFKQPGVPRTAFEKIDDAAEVHRLTGCCPSVALHIPWDAVDDYDALADHAAERGVRIGAINPNVFQDDEYKLGSLCHPDKAVRDRALDHILQCCDVMRATDSKLLSLWFADGTNYAGQDHIRRRHERMQDGLEVVYRALPPGSRMLVEYKFFEPGFYHTDLPDWGTALLHCQALGPQAQVLVDTGHHPQATNIAHIVALLLEHGKLGGFHFNDRKYADDDLIVGSVDPFALFLIFNEIVDALDDPTTEATAQAIAYMIDQSFNIEPKMPAMLQSVLNVQTAWAKALLVDRAALRDRQDAGDVLGGYAVLQAAFETDVRSLTARAREELGGAADPLAVFASSGYSERAVADRVGAAQGWGG
ncbi:MAG: L-rhamnose isomerase [Anaerolineae bacterium]|nr:L-rhamnose isomerase [Anaerolineae bacterium]